MATIAAPRTAAVEREDERSGIWSWITTTDHKRIGVLYLYTSLFFFVFGGLEAGVIRWQLRQPNSGFITAEQYNQIFTMHGTTMIFLAVMPLSAVFFNFLIPLQIGARDVAFPRLNAFSYWVYLFGGLFITLPIFFGAAPDGGWFGYAPLTTKAYSPGLHIDFWVLGLQILGISTLAAGFNFITTIINMRAPGMHLMRMPLFTWNAFVVQFLIVLAFPVITIALVFLQFDRFFGTNFYTVQAGADPLLWQHLFWIFGHPEVYILILPSFGLVSEIIPTFSRKPVFGYPVMVYATILIGFLGFGVWAHHMFAVGMGPIADSVFGLTTMLIAIPTGVKIFNWIGTMAGGNVRFTTAMCFATSMVAMFVIGGISGIMHSSPPADLQQTDTYFIVAHFHYVLVGGAIQGTIGGIYYYFPKIFGRMMSEKLGKVSFWLFFIGFNLTFMPMHWLGMGGMPRRIYTYDSGQGWDTLNAVATVGYFIMALGVLVFVVNFFISRKNGEIAGNNPWDAATLEWSIPSPPPVYNFAQLPRVTSRYPLWDLTHPEMTVDVPHDGYGDSTTNVHIAGKDTHREIHQGGPDTRPTQAAEAPMHVETEYLDPEALGIAIPYSTPKPMFCALSIVVMFLGLIFYFPVVYLGAAGIVFFLYDWLTDPLEPAHH